MYEGLLLFAIPLFKTKRGEFMIEFEYNGKSSSEFGIIITSIEENNELESRSLILGQKNKYRARENHFGTTYDKNYSFNITFIKDLCKKGYYPSIETRTVDEKDVNVLVFPELPTLDKDTNILQFPSSYDLSVSNGILLSQHSDYFTSNDIKILNSWLTSPQIPKLLKIKRPKNEYDNYYFEDIDFFATITAVNVESIGKPYQITYTVTCDSPYGYTPEKIVQASSTDFSPTHFVIDNQSDCTEEYIYPVLKITPHNNKGEISLLNTSDNNNKLSLNLKNYTGDSFYMDCQNMKLYQNENNVETALTFEELGIDETNIENIYWLRLCSGKNDITIHGNIYIDIIYREPRKVGAFI